jgi:predicted RNA binding protein YcfA (HicA-like mRNA interferase family)
MDIRLLSSTSSPACFPKEEKRQQDKMSVLAQVSLVSQQNVHAVHSFSSTELRWIKELCENYKGNPETLCLIDLIGLDVTKKWNDIKQDTEALSCQFKKLMVEIKFKKSRPCLRGQMDFYFQPEEDKVVESLKELIKFIEDDCINKFYECQLYTYVSFSATQAFSSKFEKYIDNKHILSKELLQKRVTANLNDTKKAVATIITIFNNLEPHLKELKNPEKEAAFNESMKTLRRKTIIFNLLFKNIIDLWEKEDAQTLLCDKNIDFLAPDHAKLLIPKNLNEAEKSCKALLHYHDAIFGKKIKSSQDPLFENLLKAFPSALTYPKLIEFTLSIQEKLSQAEDTSASFEEIIHLVFSGKVNHEQFCNMYNIQRVFPKKQEEFISYFCFLRYKQGVQRLCLRDIYCLMQQSIHLINPQHTDLRSRSMCQLMVNFKELQRMPTIFSSIQRGSENPLTLFQEEVKLDMTSLVQKMRGEFDANFTTELLVIASTFGEVFEDATMWVLIPLFNKNQKALNAFYHHMEALKELKEKYCFRLAAIKEKNTLTQAKKILEGQSHYLVRFVFFIKDIEALLGKFTEKELEQETYLLPKELMEFLDLEGFEQSIITPTSSEDEEKALPLEEVPVMTEKEIEKAATVPSNKDQENSLSKELAPQKGEKLRKYFKRLKKMKVALGLDRVTGSHKHFKGMNGALATIPDHGGGTILKRGTGKSVGEQIAKIFEEKKLSFT